MRGFSLIETLMVACIAAVLIGLTLFVLSDYRERHAGTIDAELREVAIDQIYEQRGITADEIWIASARAELARRGLVGPLDLNRQTLAVYVDASGPYDPALVIPDRYDPQTLAALGLTEPVFNR
jgi:type II secretory pathway pseudopilin PulG